MKYYYYYLSIVYDMKLNALTVSESCVRQRVILKTDDPTDRSKKIPDMPVVCPYPILIHAASCEVSEGHGQEINFFETCRTTIFHTLIERLIIIKGYHGSPNTPSYCCICLLLIGSGKFWLGLVLAVESYSNLIVLDLC